MKIFADFHHAGMAQGIMRLFGDRLGHEVHFPTQSFCMHVSQTYPQKDGGKVWTYRSEDMDTWFGCENVPEFVDRDSFCDIPWDLILVTRTESQPILTDLLSKHALGAFVKLLALHGNQGGGYDYGQVVGLLTSDLSTAYLAPLSLPKLHYSQELGRHFMDLPFIPLNQDSIRRVHCYMNFLNNYRTPYSWHLERDRDMYHGICPHCATSGENAGEPLQSTSQLWYATAENVAKAGISCYSFGKGCEQGNISNASLPRSYTSAALTWHYKHVEGYGFSLLQSPACGRLAIVQPGFYKYRTAGRYLIPDLTCFEVGWDAAKIADVIRWYCSDLDRANEYALSCYNAARGLMQWDHEAARVKSFLETLNIGG